MAGVAHDHVGQDAAGDPHQADQVGRNDVGPVVRRANVETGAAPDIMPGIVDENIDRLEGVGDQFEQPVDVFGVGDVELHRKGIVTHLGRERPQRLCVAVDEDHPASAFEQGACDGASHAARGAGHDGVTARYFSHDESLQGNCSARS